MFSSYNPVLIEIDFIVNRCAVESFSNVILVDEILAQNHLSETGQEYQRIS